ncbi:hypothetical protein VTO42DRAFT_5411 [Malbranchea cinnamomea]
MMSPKPITVDTLFDPRVFASVFSTSAWVSAIVRAVRDSYVEGTLISYASSTLSRGKANPHPSISRS